MLRALRITAVLVFLGAVAGAVGATVSLVVVELVVSGPITEVEYWAEIATNASLFGACCGVVAAPVLWWTMLRAIPARRSAIETALATSFAAGFTVSITGFNGWSVLAMGLVGAALSVVRLRREFLGD